LIGPNALFLENLLHLILVIGPNALFLENLLYLILVIGPNALFLENLLHLILLIGPNALFLENVFQLILMIGPSIVVYIVIENQNMHQNDHLIVMHSQTLDSRIPNSLCAARFPNCSAKMITFNLYDAV
jgi:hypothetical protein